MTIKRAEITKIPPTKELNPGYSFKISQAKIGARITCKSIIRDTSEAEIYFGPVNISKLPIGTQIRQKLKGTKLFPVQQKNSLQTAEPKGQLHTSQWH